MLHKLLGAFEGAFRGQVYKHRVAYIGDSIAACLYEDVYDLGHSPAFNRRVDAFQIAINTGNQIKGKKGRRGDGTLGRVVPTVSATRIPGFAVPRGLVAHLEIGAEVKIAATKLLAQVDRVVNDLKHQARVFSEHNIAALKVGFVGVNFASRYIGHEGERQYTAKSPPAREAPEFARRMEQLVAPYYDELLVMRFKAANTPPYEFEWVDELDLHQRYGSLVVRVCAEYTRRF